MVKKVLFVIPYLADGGAERALSSITLHWQKDWQIDILVNSDLQRDYDYYGNIISLKIDKKKKVDSVFFQLYAFIKRVIKLRKLKRNGGYLACISFLDSANVANIITGKHYCKTIVSIRSSLSACSNKFNYKYIVNPLVKLLYNKADKIVAVSEELKRELIKDFKLEEKRIECVQNGYDLMYINSMAERNSDGFDQYFCQNKKIVITAGRLSDQKYHWHLIRAFKKVKNVLGDVELIIAGRGDLEDYLKSVIYNTNLDEDVKLIGQCDNIFNLYSKSDLFMIPSGWEGFPNALAEAMCVGLPCIATDFHTGAREILAPELLNDDKPVEDIVKATYGILTPLCSGTKYEGNEPLEPAEEKLAEAMIEMLENDELREHYKKQSIVRSESYSIDDAVKKWINLITE